MNFPSPKKLSSPEIQLLRAKAAKGLPITLEETAAFVLSSRASFLALPPPKKGEKKKEKEQPPSVENDQIDFF